MIFTRGCAHETGILERQRPAGLPGQGISGLLCRGRRGHHLPAGDEDAPEQAEFDLPGYHRYWNSADKAGYSGTAVFTRRQPLSVTYDFGIDEHRHEGRVITAEYPDFYLVCCYTPNSKDQLARLDYRMAWEDDIRTTCWIWTPKSLWCTAGT